jgi:uncharacterized repeat protein (TIGR04052 family)
MAVACSEARQPVTIKFMSQFEGRDVSCEHDAADVLLTDLRFYVYDVQLVAADGALTPLKLDDKVLWQQDDLGLVDLENGRGACTNGTAETRNFLQGTARTGAYEGLQFTIGVPFDRNHADPLAANPPLDDPAMHWHWRAGYKFLRAGVRTDDDGFWMHLGSTGCEGTVGNISGCRAPNRVTVHLDEFVAGQDTVVVELGELVSPDELQDGEASDCSSGPSEAECLAPFEALGLDHMTGGSSGIQRLFKSRATR